MRGIAATLSIVLLVSVMNCGSVWAQATAQLSGSVRDQSGAVLPGVEVTAVQTDTGVSRSTVTNETGYYVLSNLPLGPYRLEAALPGFRTFAQTGIVLQVGSNPTINIVLEIGQVTEQVEVQANAALVETRNVSVGQVMETQRIVELPLNGRNVQELLLLGGGAVQVGVAGGFLYPNRLLIASAGTLGTSTETTLDGIRHVDPYDGTAMPLPFPDALAEFKTEIGGQGADRAQGAQVSAVTRSGTNAFHGNLFEFHRNDLFNARNYFATKGSTLKRNQFGGTLGGPIMANKLFFFGGYQGTILRQDPADERQFVPTAAMLAGDFTAFAAPACNAGRQLSLRAPFVNNRIDPTLFSPVARQVADRLPKTDNSCGEVTFGRKTINDEHQFTTKIDHQASNQHSLFGRFFYAYFRKPSSSQFTPNNVLTAGDLRQVYKSYAATLGSTYLINSTTVNSARLSVTRQRRDQAGPQYFALSEFGARIYDGYQPGVSQVGVNSGFNLSPGNKWVIGTVLVQLADDISMTRGTHQIAFGGRVAQARSIGRFADGQTPNFQFNGQVTGHGLADFLLGRPSGVTQAGGQRLSEHVNYVSLYINDTWQWTPRLTVSAGLRWDPILPHVDLQQPVPYLFNWDEDRYRQGLRSSVFVNAPPGLIFPGDPGFQQKYEGADTAKPRASIWDPYWNVFQPRIGFAWDVEGNGRTSVRASYGMTVEQYPGNTRLGTQTTMPPYGALARILAPDGGLEDPWRTFPGGNPHPAVISKNMPFPAGSDYMPEKARLVPTAVQSWNLSLQREVARNTLVSASYMGTQMIHLQYAHPLNPAIYVPGVGDSAGNCFLNGQATHFRVAPGAACSTPANTQDRRRLSFLNPALRNEIGRLAMREAGAVQNYNGLLLSVQTRANQRINLNGNYTLSHCAGDYSSRANSGYGASVVHTLQDPNDRRRDHGNCEIDQRHNFNFTGVLETPQFTNRTVSLLATGWRLSTIYRRNSAGNIYGLNRSTGPKTVTLGPAATAQTASGSDQDRCLCEIANQRPNLVLPDAVYLDKSGRPNTQWLNPAAFALPAVGSLGNMGRANLRLPTYWQFDLALARVFRVRENQTVEFRAEAYNVLNSFRPGEINTDFTSAQFGKIRNALDPRIMQFALKYAF